MIQTRKAVLKKSIPIFFLVAGAISVMIGVNSSKEADMVAVGESF